MKYEPNLDTYLYKSVTLIWVVIFLHKITCEHPGEIISSLDNMCYTSTQQFWDEELNSSD